MGRRRTIEAGEWPAMVRRGSPDGKSGPGSRRGTVDQVREPRESHGEGPDQRHERHVATLGGGQDQVGRA